ncbi:MAG: hypothetical protein AB7N91_18900 [Candidatus Tectimicrobiota bacterium]
MYRNIIRNTTIALGTLLVSSSLVLAAGLQGSVTALDGKGMGTVRTSDGKDHQVKVGPEFKVGSKVECDMKHNAMECRLGSPQASAQPAPAASTQGSTAVKTPATPAPATQAPAASTSGTTSSPTATPAPAAK